MRRLRLPKTSTPKGLKVYCNKCKAENPSCSHIERQVYRARFHIKGTKNGVIIVTLQATEFEDAVQEFMSLKKQHNNNMLFAKPKKVREQNDDEIFSLPGAVKKYYQYMTGNYQYKHKQKQNLSRDYIKEVYRNVVKFLSCLSKNGVKVQELPVYSITQAHVSLFYESLEDSLQPRTMNKVLAQVKKFFEFVIDIEEVKMDNPFEIYNPAITTRSKKRVIRKDEFEKILQTIDAAETNHKTILSNGTTKNMYFPYLKDAFRLGLFTGGRREEVVNLRWSDLQINKDGNRYFVVDNLKVNRQKLSKTQIEEDNEKIFVVNADFMDLLNELGYENKKNTHDFVLAPDRTIKAKTMMDNISKAFTHYRKEANIEKEVQFKSLRKTYLTWLYVALEGDAKLLSGHSSDAILEKYYLDPKTTQTINKAVNFRIFGT